MTGVLERQAETTQLHLRAPDGAPFVWKAASLCELQTLLENSSQSAPPLHNGLLRFYSPGMGRWINRDPIKERGGINLYAMVHNNPINKIDEYGENAAALPLAAAGPPGWIALGVITIGTIAYVAWQYHYMTSSGMMSCPTIYRAQEGLDTDATGKVHGELPSAQDLKDLPTEALEDTIEALWESIKNRKQENDRLGHDGPHQRRVGQEENLVRSLEKVLRGRR